MSRRQLFLGTALVGLAMAAASAPLAAQERAGANVEVRRISNILKTKVVIQEDKPAGEIVDVVYNDGGCIDYYVASYDNRQYVVPFDVVQYRAADRLVFVDIAPAQFERVHFFSANQWPDLYAPGFRDQVFASFNVRAGGRNRTTFRQGTDVDVDIRNRDRDARDRDPANRDRDNATDRDRANRDQNTDRNRPDADRNRPEADRNRPEPRDGNRPAPSTDRPERNPSTAPGANDDRPSAEPRDSNTPAPPRPGSGTNPGRDGAVPPRAGSDTNPGRGSTPPRPGVNPGSNSGSGSSSGSNPPSSSSGNTPRPGSGDNKPLSPPPVVPK